VGLLNDIKERLLSYAKDILDKEKHNDLSDLFEQWRNEVEKPHDIFLNIIKYFVLSPVEKNYIQKIQDELLESEKLDEQID
jgi:hypothetical protein